MGQVHLELITLRGNRKNPPLNLKAFEPMELFPEFESENLQASNEPQIPPLREATLRELYRLAGLIRKCEPWKHLRDEDLLGIESPETGKTALLSILGQAGQAYALQLYLPEEGIRFWNDIAATGDLLLDDVQFRLRLLDCAFENRRDAHPRDVELQERHGEISRKRHSWAVFRSYRPGYIPWFLEEAEAGELIRAMRLFLHFREAMVSRGSEGTRLWERERPLVVPVVRLAAGGDADVPSDWTWGETPFPVAECPSVRFEPGDDGWAATLKALPVRPGTWEIGAFWLPTPIFEGERPYFPKIALCAGLEQDMLSEPVIYGGAFGDDTTALRQAFANLAEQHRCLPAKVRVGSEVAESALRSLSRVKRIEVFRGEQEFLPLLAASMTGFFSAAMDSNSAGFVESGESGSFPEMPFALGQDFGSRSRRDPLGRSAATPPEPPSGRQRYTLRIDLVGVQHPIWRRITIPADATFLHLHHAIQDAFGWENCHLYEFAIGKGRSPRRIGPPMIEAEIDDETPLESVLGSRFKELQYVYDFGDNWIHRITVESMTEEEAPDPAPRLLGGAGIAPPEDCGGIWGFEALLDGTSAWCSEMEPDYLEHLRKGVFDPNSVVFGRVYPARGDGEILDRSTGPDEPVLMWDPDALADAIDRRIYDADRRARGETGLSITDANVKSAMRKATGLGKGRKPKSPARAPGPKDRWIGSLAAEIDGMLRDWIQEGLPRGEAYEVLQAVEHSLKMHRERTGGGRAYLDFLEQYFETGEVL